MHGQPLILTVGGGGRAGEVMPRQGKLGLLTDCEGRRSFVFEPLVMLAGMAGGPLGSFISTPMELVKVQVRRSRPLQTDREGRRVHAR